jgi:hypothetical protein
MLSSRGRAVTLSAAVVAAVFTLTGARAARDQRDRLPDRIADSTFWRIVTTFSEASGYFSSENFVSNETEWQYVIPAALDRVGKASAYLGVGPEQNFTYIASFHPRIAFICDIRRQNMMEHLMYKALIEMSSDRADFLSKLWSRRRPEGLDSASEGATIAAAYAREKPDSLFLNLTLGAIFDRLVNQHKFALNSEDSATVRAVYSVFFRDGPDVSYSSSSRLARGPLMPLGSLRGPTVSANGGVIMMPGATGMISFNTGTGTTTYRITTDSTGQVRVMRDSAGMSVPDTNFKFQPGSSVNFAPPFSFGGGYATFGSLMAEDDGAGVNRGWLGSEAAFQWLRDFERRNLLIPVVGDFAGPKALRSIGRYLRENDAHVSAFYTSNVEQYLFQNAVNGEFYENVATLPTEANSMFIRSFPNLVRGGMMPRRPGSRLAQTTSSIDTVVRAHRNGLLTGYIDLARLQDR